jgi:L-iditol 2-dehydrogenase
MFGVNDVRVVESPKPQINEREVLIKVRACGVCPTDVRKYRTGDGGTLKLPLNLGHEYAGDAMEVGAQVPHVRPGMRVSGEWFVGYADFAKPPAERVSGLLELPASVTYEEATFLEPLADCFHCIGQQANAMVGDKIAIIGAGTMGVLKLMVAKAAGLQVMSCDMLEHRRTAAKGFGADLVVSPEEIEKTAREWTDGKGLDAVILSAGIPVAVNQALTMVKNRGTVVMFGGFKRGSTATIDPNLIHYKEAVLTGSFWVGAPPHGDRQFYRKALQAIADKSVPVAKLITHRFPLEDIVKALEAAESLEGYKVMINVS